MTPLREALERAEKALFAAQCGLWVCTQPTNGDSGRVAEVYRRRIQKAHLEVVAALKADEKRPV